MSLTTNGANQQLTWALTTLTAPTRPTTWYVALHTADPTEAGTSSELTVGQASGYTARQAVTFGTPASSIIANTNTITFNVGTITGGVTITHISIRSVSTVGETVATNTWYYGALSTAKTLTTSDALTFAVGELTIFQD